MLRLNGDATEGFGRALRASGLDDTSMSFSNHVGYELNHVFGGAAAPPVRTVNLGAGFFNSSPKTSFDNAL
jgi:hypothetical protein